MRPTLIGVLLALALGSGASAQQAKPAPGAAQAEEVFGKIIEALGGDAYLKIRDLTGRGRLYSFNRGELAGPGEQHFIYYSRPPDKERQEFGKKGNVVYLYNGEAGWELDRQGIRDMVPEQIESFQEGNRREMGYLLRARQHGEKVQVYYLGREFADNRRMHVVELVNDRAETFKLYADEGTYLPAQFHFRERDALTGEWIDVTEYYGKYVKVQGIQTPMQFTRTRAGFRSLEVFWKEITYNSDLPDELFTRASLEQRWQKVK